MDVTDATAPSLVYDAVINGHYQEAHLVDGHLYVVSHHGGINRLSPNELVNQDELVTSPAPYIDAIPAQRLGSILAKYYHWRHEPPH